MCPDGKEPSLKGGIIILIVVSKSYGLVLEKRGFNIPFPMMRHKRRDTIEQTPAFRVLGKTQRIRLDTIHIAPLLPVRDINLNMKSKASHDMKSDMALRISISKEFISITNNII